MKKQQVSHLGWEYIFDPEGETKYQVLPPEGKDSKCPELLYKIYGVTDYSVDGLEKGELFASQPANFNDPFDSHFQLLNLEKGINLDKLDSKIPKEFLKDKDELSKMLTRQQYMQDVFFRNTGIICLSEKPNHIPMWSYYGQEHQGFMIGFQPKKLAISGDGPFPMNYQEKFGPIPVSKYGIDIAVHIQMNLKNMDWKHESEWRILARSSEQMKTTFFPTGASRTFKYDRSAVSMIGLGYNFFNQEERTVFDDKIIVKLARMSDGSLDDNQILKERVLRAIISNKYTVYNVFRNEKLLSHIAFHEATIEELDDGVFHLTRVVGDSKR